MATKQQNGRYISTRPSARFTLTLIFLLVVGPLLLAAAMLGAVPASLTQSWGPIPHPWSVPAALTFWGLMATGVATALKVLLDRVTS
jgi:hypothetical protein